MKNIDAFFLKACSDNDLDGVKSTLRRGADITCKSAQGENGLLKSFYATAFYPSDFEVFKYLSASPELKQHCPIHECDRFGKSLFLHACQAGRVDMLEFLLLTPEIELYHGKKVDIHQQRDSGFIYACKYGHLAVVEFLLASPKLKKHINIHANVTAAQRGFSQAVEFSHRDIVQYLVMEQNLTVPPSTLQALSHTSQIDFIEQLLQVRHLRQQLSLDNNVSTPRKNKI